MEGHLSIKIRLQSVWQSLLGSLLVGWGFILCYTTKGEYYNADEVQAMVAAEMIEERKKQREEEEMFDDIGAENGQVRS